MERISRDEMLSDIARTVARRGTCLRLQVGAVLSRDGRVISTGYNGAPRKLEHCGPSQCQLDSGCTWATHAELNAITSAARYGISTDGSTMHCTDSPCVACCKAIINAGIVEVIYTREYRIVDGLNLLTAAGVKYRHAT